MFSPEFPELLYNLIVPANLLVDGKDQGVEGEHTPQG